MTRAARFAWLGGLVASIWAVAALNLVTGYGVNRFLALEPRALDGLIGVPAMPLLHASLRHAAANTPPLIVLGVLMGLTAPMRLLPVSLLVVLGGGLGVWLLGRNALHVGASGLIFGWFGFLLARGFVERNLVSVAVAALVGLLYGAMIWGVLPTSRHVSWEAHLFGFLAGVAGAYLFRKEP